MDAKIQFIRNIAYKTMENKKIPNMVKRLVNEVCFAYCNRRFEKL